jgi:ubiquitin carboxyl-terminal hydrolase 5/13
LNNFFDNYLNFKLIPVYGPGFTGLRGNSCYMNSVVQVLFTIPDFVEKYFRNYEVYVSSAPVDPSNTLSFQLSKPAFGLLSGRYSTEPNVDETNKHILRPPKGIKPTSFKVKINS